MVAVRALVWYARLGFLLSFFLCDAVMVVVVLTVVMLIVVDTVMVWWCCCFFMVRLLCTNSLFLVL